MGHVLFLLEPLAEVARANRFWMTWNLILAAVPLALAVPVFRWTGHLTIWAGHAVTRSLGRTAGQALGALGGRLWAALEHRPGLRPL